MEAGRKAGCCRSTRIRRPAFPDSTEPTPISWGPCRHATQTFTVQEYLDDSGNWPYPSGDVITIADSTANLSGLTAGQITAFGTNNVDFVDSLNDVLTWNVAQWQAVPSGLGFDVNDLKIVSDTGANIAGLSTGDLADLNTYGVTQLNPSDGTLDITAAQYGALGGISIDQGADVTLADTGANISGLSAGEIGALAIKGVDHLDASDDAYSLDVGQATALGGVTIDASDTVTLSDTGANIAALTATDFANLGAAGISVVDASDDALTLDDSQFSAITNNGMTLTAGDDVTLADTGATIAAHDFSVLSAAGVDLIDATDGAMSISVNQANELIAGDVAIADSSDVVTLYDSGFNLAAMTAGDLSLLGSAGVDVIDASDDGVAFSIAQLDAINSAEVGLTASDEVSLNDSTANIDALTSGEIGGYITQGVDYIDAVSGTGAYTIDKATASIVLASGLQFAGNDTVTVADTGANLAGLSTTELAAMASHGIDALDASDDALSLSLAQLDAAATGGVALTGSDTVTASDTSAHFEALTVGQIAAYGAQGVDIVDATDNVLHLTVAQGFAGFAAGIELTASDTVTVLDTGANISAVSASDMDNLGADGFDIIDATDDAYSLSKAQADALLGSGVALTAADVVTVAGDDSMIGSLSASDIGNYGEFGIDLIHATDGTGSVSVVQANAAAGSSIAFTAADTWTVLDTGANISGLSASAISAMVADGIDSFDASDNAFNLTVDQYLAAAGHLTAGDTITLADAGANIAGLSAAQIGQLAANGIDRINATDDVLALTVAQFGALGGVTLAGGDTVSIRDTGANLATLNFSALAGAHVDAIDATDNVLTLSIAQFNSLGTVVLAAGDTVTLADTSANIGALSSSQLLSLAGKGIDVIDATDNVLNLSLSQFNNLGSVVLTAADTVTVSATGAQIGAFGTNKLAQMDAAHVDFIDASDGSASITAAHYGALGSMKFVADDAIKLSDTGANIAALSAAQISGLAGKNIDSIDASDNTLSLDVSQINALGTVTLTGPDYVTLSDAGATIASQSTSFLSGLYAKGVDIIDASDNVLNLSVAKFQALNVYGSAPSGPIHPNLPSATSIQLTGADDVTLVDTGTNLAALSASQIENLQFQRVDHLNSTTDLLTLNLSQFDALGEVGLTLADVVTIADTGANLALGIDTAEVSVMGGQGVDRIDATDNTLSLSKSVIDDLQSASIALTAADTVTMTAGEASLEALTGGQLAAYAAYGVDYIDSANDELFLNASQVAAMANTGLKAVAGDDVTLSDTSASILANLGALFGSLSGAGVDHIDLQDNGINLTVAQATALNGVNFDASDTGVTVLDSSANLEALTAAQITALGAAGVDTVDATDDTLTISVDQAGAGLFAGLELTAGDDVTIADTGANIATMSKATIELLADYGIDHVTLSDHHVSLNYGQYTAFIRDFDFSTLDTVTVKGNNGDNTMIGAGEDNVFLGKGGDDVLDGGAGQDTLNGGHGADVLTGGIGSDTFVFNSTADSAVGHADRITDLTNIDVIDLSSIDADINTAGDQAFTEVNKFTGHAGEMMIKYNAGADLTLIKLDVDGDGHADSQIAIEGNHHSFDNFVL